MASSTALPRPAAKLLAALEPGDLLLLGARPGQGKTLLGIELAATAALNGGNGFFFTLEYTNDDVQRNMRLLGLDRQATAKSFVVDTSDEICASRIVSRLGRTEGPVIATVDYLQILDQRRSNPDLAAQVRELKAFATGTGSIIVMVSQIDRRFDTLAKPLPDIADIRLPNPIDLSLFTKSCFLHDGQLRFAGLA